MSRCICAQNEVAYNHLEKLASTNDENGNLKFKISYLKAMKSLKQAEKPIKSLDDALLLNGVGNSVAHEILSAFSKSGIIEDWNQGNKEINASSNINMKKGDKQYLPEKGKLPWCILLTIYHLEKKLKSEIIYEIQNNKLFKDFTINCKKEAWWRSIKILREKNIINTKVTDRGTDGPFYLTPEGQKTAEIIKTHFFPTKNESFPLKRGLKESCSSVDNLSNQMKELNSPISTKPCLRPSPSFNKENKNVHKNRNLYNYWKNTEENMKNKKEEIIVIDSDDERSKEFGHFQTDQNVQKREDDKDTFVPFQSYLKTLSNRSLSLEKPYTETIKNTENESPILEEEPTLIDENKENYNEIVYNSLIDRLTSASKSQEKREEKNLNIKETGFSENEQLLIAEHTEKNIIINSSFCDDSYDLGNSPISSSKHPSDNLSGQNKHKKIENNQNFVDLTQAESDCDSILDQKHDYDFMKNDNPLIQRQDLSWEDSNNNQQMYPEENDDDFVDDHDTYCNPFEWVNQNMSVSDTIGQNNETFEKSDNLTHSEKNGVRKSLFSYLPLEKNNFSMDKMSHSSVEKRENEDFVEKIDHNKVVVESKEEECVIILSQSSTNSSNSDLEFLGYKSQNQQEKTIENQENMCFSKNNNEVISLSNNDCDIEDSQNSTGSRLFQMMKQKQLQLGFIKPTGNPSFLKTHSFPVQREHSTEASLSELMSQTEKYEKPPRKRKERTEKNTIDSKLSNSNTNSHFSHITSLSLSSSSSSSDLIPTAAETSLDLEKGAIPSNAMGYTTSNVDDWEIELFIDVRERGNAFVQSSLITQGIPCSLRTLAVGDFIWVAKKKGIPAGESEGLVLDCVVERKSIQDLSSSLVDGRYAEQKMRLQSTGIRQCVYLVEGEQICLAMQLKAITAAHIKTAIIATHIDSRMHVLKTRNLDHTISCLKNLHQQISRRFYRGGIKEENTQSFGVFQSSFGKKSANNFRQLFGHQLRQIHGCSKSAAMAIVNQYGTAANFYKTFKDQERSVVEKLLANTNKEGGIAKRLGPQLARRIWQVYFSDY